jgi:HSP20 family protein
LPRDRAAIIRVGKQGGHAMTNFVRYEMGRGLGMPSILGWDPVRVLDELIRWDPLGAQTMPLRVNDDEDGATITVDMPGVDVEDVDLTLHAGTLTITGKRGEQTYRYRVALTDAIDPNSFEADLAKGVLTIRAHKRPEAKPRKIALGSCGTAHRARCASCGARAGIRSAALPFCNTCLEWARQYNLAEWDDLGSGDQLTTVGRS